MITIGYTLDFVQPMGMTPQATQDRAYITSIEQSGAVPILIPALRDSAALRYLYDACDAIVMPGGRDVDSSLYAADQHATTQPIDAAVEAAEVQLLRWALADDKPVLAICRGQQLLNVLLGGTLHQDIDMTAINHKPADMVAPAHPIDIVAGSALHAVVGADTAIVNSQHHQAVDQVGSGLVVTATASDGVIEAMESTQHSFVVAVQFHPEVMTLTVAWAAGLFAALAHAVAVPRLTGIV